MRCQDTVAARIVAVFGRALSVGRKIQVGWIYPPVGRSAASPVCSAAVPAAAATTAALRLQPQLRRQQPLRQRLQRWPRAAVLGRAPPPPAWNLEDLLRRAASPGSQWRLSGLAAAGAAAAWGPRPRRPFGLLRSEGGGRKKRKQRMWGDEVSEGGESRSLPFWKFDAAPMHTVRL